MTDDHIKRGQRCLAQSGSILSAEIREEKEMKVIIAGSRDIDKESAYFAIGKCMGRLAVRDIITKEIVSGGARGVDTYAIAIAKHFNFGLKVFPADWKKHGKKAGYIRNAEMAEYADALVAIWDGKSPGTKMMIDIAKKKGMPMEVEIIEVKK